ELMTDPAVTKAMADLDSHLSEEKLMKARMTGIPQGKCRGTARPHALPWQRIAPATPPWERYCPGRSPVFCVGARRAPSPWLKKSPSFHDGRSSAAAICQAVRADTRARRAASS